MRTGILGILLWTGLVAVAMAADPASLTLTVTDVPEADGEVWIALYNTEATWLETPALVATVAAEQGTARWETELLAGDYAVAVFHDANRNGDLDRNIIGLPTEAYGFSNGARGKYGPAKWGDARVQVGGSGTRMRISLE